MCRRRRARLWLAAAGIRDQHRPPRSPHQHCTPLLPSPPVPSPPISLLDGPQFCISPHLHFNGVCRGHRRRQRLVDSLSPQLITANATPSQKSGRSLSPVISVLADWIGAERRQRGWLQGVKRGAALYGACYIYSILFFFPFGEMKIFHGRPETEDSF